MIGYKFLDESGYSVFTGARWPLPVGDAPGPWVESAVVEPCRSGVHACRPADLSYWLATSLWVVDLAGDIVESRHKVVATRGRLVRHVTEYVDAVRELAAVSADRARSLAERSQGTASHATLTALAGDATDLATDGLPAQTPFVAACVAGLAAAATSQSRADFDGAFTAERRFQSAWLADRLRLV